MSVTPETVARMLKFFINTGRVRPTNDVREQILDWRKAFPAWATDGMLREAYEMVSGKTSYGQLTPGHLIEAMEEIRSKRIRDWLERNTVPNEERDGLGSCAYRRAFLAAIGDGEDEIEADRHGRACVTMARSIAANNRHLELPTILQTLETCIVRGERPWAGELPPARMLLPAVPASGEAVVDAKTRMREIAAGVASRRAASDAAIERAAAAHEERMKEIIDGVEEPVEEAPGTAPELAGDPQEGPAAGSRPVRGVRGGGEPSGSHQPGRSARPREPEVPLPVSSHVQDSGPVARRAPSNRMAENQKGAPAERQAPGPAVSTRRSEENDHGEEGTDPGP